jgi:CheY-like chemotaxis protein
VTSADISSALLLNVGYDQALLSTRTLVLRSAGYIVESAVSIEEAFQRFRTGDFDLVILCHSIPEEARQRLIQQIRDYGSATPVVFIAANAAAGDRFADFSVDSLPRSLLRTIDAVLSEGSRKGTGWNDRAG